MKKKSNINPRLLWLAGAAGGDAPPIELGLAEDGEFTFGRDSVCDLPVKDIAVSRKHCRIIRDGEEFRLEDLASHNGTFVNETSVTTSRLTHGDRIRVGNAQFMFLLDVNRDAPPVEARFDDGTLVTNSAIRIFPNESAADFPTDLSVLIKLGKAINEIKEADRLQARLLEIILTFVPAQRGAILLTDEDLNTPKTVCVTAKNFSDNAPMQISSTVSRQVLREQVALLSNDLADENLRNAESLIAARTTSVLCVPLRFGERKGLIYLDTRDVDTRFTETHLEQMTAVSFLVSAALSNAESIETLRQENEILKDNLQIESSMVGESEPLNKVFGLISRVAAADSTVLIMGESGTGKELAAQAIHRNSPRSQKPFAAINCAVLNENLLEAELFGYEKGAFTGATTQKKGKLEVADGGTVFLDEIGELAHAIQVKLLRVLQEREFERVGGTKTIRVNVRVLAATNRNLEAEVESGKFRRDLYFRLNVVQVKMPPLRERKSDIPLLARHFIEKYSERCHRNVRGLSSEAAEILLAHDWQGNIRELENVIERAVVLGSDNVIQPQDLPVEMVEAAAPTMEFTGDFNQQLKEAKQKIVLSAIRYSKGNYSEAARLLGVHPNNLHRILRGLGIKGQ